jgi:hypothetical protein
MNKDERVWTHTAHVAPDVAGDEKKAAPVKPGDEPASDGSSSGWSRGYSMSARAVIKMVPRKHV